MKAYAKTTRKKLLKFLLLLGVFFAYFCYLWWKYDLVTGGLVAGLTWTFFVLCTPVADAGFLLDFPVRLITGIPMILSELAVWAIAISTNFFALRYDPGAYDKSFLTTLLHKILLHPWPYWSIIILCASGTFLSIWFGDEIIHIVKTRDSTKTEHKERHARAKWLLPVTIAIFIIIAVAYYDLLASLGISLHDVDTP